MVFSESFDPIYERCFASINGLGVKGGYAMVNTLFLCLPFILTYFVTWIIFDIRHRSKNTMIVPPTAPYIVPLLGHTLSFIWNTLPFACSITTYRGKSIPVRLTFIRGRLFLVQGANNIVSIWKSSQVSTATAVHNFYLKQIFGMPERALRLYAADNSGCHNEPHADSNVLPQNRIDHITHGALNRFLLGPGLDPFFDRFTENLMERLESLEIGEEWVDMEDLWGLLKSEVTPAAIKAMCGSSIFSVAPSIAEDLWTYDSAIPDLVKGLPRWWVPKSYAKRDNILQSIKTWHTFARAHFDESQISSDGDWDPNFGSEFIRSRQATFWKMDGMDHDAMAASDLGAIWATNTNAVPSTFWCTLSCFSDSLLLPRVREEVEKCVVQTATGKDRFDIKALGKNPLLQSIYAETLRLRIAAFIMRSPERESMKINEWILPKGEIVLIATTPAHMDEKIWNTGRANAYPLDRFWAERFLVYPGDPKSGPTKVSHKGNAEVQKGDEPRFSLDDLGGSWIPYGGGFRACPGRHFAKREILMTLAIMITLFDIDVDGSKALQTDPRANGLGAQRPRNKIPFRIRKRKT